MKNKGHFQKITEIHHLAQIFPEIALRNANLAPNVGIVVPTIRKDLVLISELVTVVLKKWQTSM